MLQSQQRPSFNSLGSEPKLEPVSSALTAPRSDRFTNQLQYWRGPDGEDHTPAQSSYQHEVSHPDPFDSSHPDAADSRSERCETDLRLSRSGSADLGCVRRLDVNLLHGEQLNEPHRLSDAPERLGEPARQNSRQRPVLYRAVQREQAGPGEFYIGGIWINE